MANDLHGAIMNIPCNPGERPPTYALAYKLGHRDARHAAAELALTAPVATEQAQAVAASAFALKWPGETRLNLSTVFDTEAEAIDWLSRVAPGVVVVPLFAASPEAAPAAMAIDRESLIDLIEDNLHAVYHCTRVWSAWGIGTMSEDDFHEARGTELAPDLADAIIAKLAAAAPAAPSAATEPQDDLLVACITLNGTTLTVEADALADMFGTDDEQHAYELTFKRMTRAAFDALGEFNGF